MKEINKIENEIEKVGEQESVTPALMMLDKFRIVSDTDVPSEDLQRRVMRLSGIKQSKYYDKVFGLAVDQRIVKTTMNKLGRVVAIPIPL